MATLRAIRRLSAILSTLIKYHLDELIDDLGSNKRVKIIFLLFPKRWFRKKSQTPRGKRIRLALEELGPLYVKFGQSLSTRPD